MTCNPSGEVPCSEELREFLSQRPVRKQGSQSNNHQELNPANKSVDKLGSAALPAEDSGETTDLADTSTIILQKTWHPAKP